MKSLENINVTLTGEPSDNEKVLISKLKRFLSGDKVRGDHLVRAGLWLVAEVIRRTETPFFKRERLKTYLYDVGGLARKQLHLTQGWPGLDVNEGAVDQQRRLLGLFDLLTRLAPDREDCFDQEG